MRSLEMFTGAGGLALGISGAGFQHEAVIELDRYACDTIRENQRRGIAPMVYWPLYQCDVTDFDFPSTPGEVDLLAGGPPCQPFSLGGKHRGPNDERNLFPEVVKAVRILRPRAILIENVKGLLRRSFSRYLSYILLQLSYPEITGRENENWTDHLSRLERHHTGGHLHDLSYRVVFRLLNAADYGVPQRRERVFIVGFRCDTDIEWSFPQPTHSQDALLWSQWVTRDYWEKHGVPSSQRPSIPARIEPKLRDLQCRLLPLTEQPWVTVRDAIGDLPDPATWRAHIGILNHQFNPGARAYPGHTGSTLDDPAKTLKAGDHGVPGGENMLAYPNGRLRYFTVREAARLQTFPDDFVFHGSWTETMRQLGNAVPVRLAQAVASGIGEKLGRLKQGEIT